MRYLMSGARPSVVLPEPLPVPPEAPEPVPGRPRRRARGWLLLLLAIVSAALIYVSRKGLPRGPSRPAATQLRTATVRIGSLEQTIRLTGTTAAERAAAVMTPYLRGSRRRGGGSSDFHLTLYKLAGGGTRVNKGDLLAEFDIQYMTTRLDDYRAEVVQHEASLRKLYAQLEVKRKAYEQRIRTARGRVDKAGLDVKTTPVRSAIQAERFRLNLEEAQASHKQLMSEAKYVEISEGAQIRRSELDLEEARVELKRAEANLERMRVRAPIDGLVVLESIRRGTEIAEVKEGDQLHRGQMFMQIIDPASMVIDAEINQVDAERLRVGARAHVHIDAYPDLDLPGRVVSLGAIAKGSRWRGDWVKHIPVRLKLLENDPRVIPNFSASVDIILERVEDVPIIPLECVFEDPATRRPHAYVRGASGWEKRELTLGLASNVEVAVREGLSRGDVVAAELPPSQSEAASARD